MAVQPAYRDAERTNNSPRSARIYKDLNLNFGRHPVTKELILLLTQLQLKEVCVTWFNMVIMKNLFIQK